MKTCRCLAPDFQKWRQTRRPLRELRPQFVGDLFLQDFLLWLQLEQRLIQRPGQPLMRQHLKFLAEQIELAVLVGQVFAQRLTRRFRLGRGRQRHSRVTERLRAKRLQLVTENLAGRFAAIAEQRHQQLLLQFRFEFFERGPVGIKKHGQFRLPFPAALLADKRQHLGALRFREQIRLRQQQNDFRRVPAQFIQQRQIAFGQRRVGTDGHQRRADVGQPVERSLRVVREGAAQAWRVHKLQRRERLERGQGDFDRRDPLLIVRIFLFADEAMRFLQLGFPSPCRREISPLPARLPRSAIA